MGDSNLSAGGDEWVTVAIRVKALDPLPDGELDSFCVAPLQSKAKNTGLSIDGQKSGANAFHFDSVHWSLGKGNGGMDAQESTQEAMYEDLGAPVVTSVLAGFNACIFAYGQTGSGKTYTMMGNYDNIASADRGLIPRISEAIFRKAAAGGTSGSARNGKMITTVESTAAGSFEITHAFDVTYVELYLERVHDLLALPHSGSSCCSSSSSSGGRADSPSPSSPMSSPGQTALRVREHPKLGPYVDGATSTRVSSYEEVMALLETGNRNRMVAATELNATSSRSHAIFTIQYTRTKREVSPVSLRRGVGKGDGEGSAPADAAVSLQQTSKLSLIDLAGSENAGKSGTKGERLKEGGSINKSLLTLGLVIKSLAMTKQHQQREGWGSPGGGRGGGGEPRRLVPYRDSALTFLLKDSLGGNSRTTMLATIRPGLAFYEETLRTLRYADRAKSIVNQAVVNEDPITRKIRSLHDQIDVLAGRLAEAQKKEEEKDQEIQVLSDQLRRALAGGGRGGGGRKEGRKEAQDSATGAGEEDEGEKGDEEKKRGQGDSQEDARLNTVAEEQLREAIAVEAAASPSLSPPEEAESSPLAMSSHSSPSPMSPSLTLAYTRTMHRPNVFSSTLKRIPGLKDGLNAPSSPFQQHGKVLLEGFLLKRGQLTGVYQRRWFMVRASTLSWYLRYNDEESLRGVLHLKGYVFEPAPVEEAERGVPYGFLMRKEGEGFARVHTLQASSKDEQVKWMHCLGSAALAEKDEGKQEEPVRRKKAQCAIM